MTMIETVEERLASLRRMLAKEQDPEDPREPLNEASVNMMLAFLDQIEHTERPAIFALRDGNVRAVWVKKNADRTEYEQIGIQFMLDGRLQYVLLTIDNAHYAGRANTSEEMIHIIRAVKVDHIWTDHNLWLDTA
jgi:hypothetical protein